MASVQAKVPFAFQLPESLPRKARLACGRRFQVLCPELAYQRQQLGFSARVLWIPRDHRETDSPGRMRNVCFHFNYSKKESLYHLQ